MIHGKILIESAIMGTQLQGEFRVLRPNVLACCTYDMVFVLFYVQCICTHVGGPGSPVSGKDPSTKTKKLESTTIATSHDVPVVSFQQACFSFGYVVSEREREVCSCKFYSTPRPHHAVC